MRSNYVVILVGVAIIMAVQAAHAQSTQTGSVSSGQTLYYSFTPSQTGPFTATLSWDNAGSTLMLILVCGTSDPISFGAALGQDRSARIEAGVIGLVPCMLGVSTMNLGAAFRLHLQSATGQLATPRIATLAGVAPSDDGALNTRLRQQADEIARMILRSAAR